MNILEQFQLTGQTAIVTGSGRGIGRGIAKGLAQAGAQVVCAARTETQLEEVVDEITTEGGEAITIRCDVRESDQLQALVDQTVARFGKVDILVNNAGGSLPGLSLITEQNAFEEAFRFNVSSAFQLSKLVLPQMIERNQGSIINISSALSHFVDSGFVAYGTAKAALSHMTRLMAYEFAPKVRINALAVGAVETDALSFVVINEDLKKQMLDLTPMGRLGQPQDIAAAVLFLASPASSWVTGKVFEIDGGTVSSSWPMTIKPF